MDAEKLAFLLTMRDVAREKLNETEEQLSAAHDANKQIAEASYADISAAIIRLFEKGKCLTCAWRLINDGPGTGGHYELSSITGFSDFEPVSRHSDPGPLYRAEQLHYPWVKPAILNRYFAYYQPNHELLKTELGLKLGK